MPIQPYRQKDIQRLKEKAVKLYKTGLSLMQVGKMLGKSHQWVKNAVDEDKQQALSK